MDDRSVDARLKELEKATSPLEQQKKRLLAFSEFGDKLRQFSRTFQTKDGVVGLNPASFWTGSVVIPIPETDQEKKAIIKGFSRFINELDPQYIEALETKRKEREAKKADRKAKAGA